MPECGCSQTCSQTVELVRISAIGSDFETTPELFKEIVTYSGELS